MKKLFVFLIICSLVFFAAAEINFESGPEDKCDVCKFFVRLIKENADQYKGIVTDPFKELVCKNTGKLKDVCMAFVEKFADVIFEQLKKIDEEKICQTMKLCEQVQILAMEAEMKNNIPCVVCEIIVKEITKQLGKSKSEIIKALVQKCEALPKFQEQCKLAVMIYGERLIDWIVEQGKNPGVVCKMVGLCPKESRMYPTDLYDPAVINPAKCIWKCLKGKYPLEKIIAVVLLCKNNVACYAIELGPNVVDCVKQCIDVSEEEVKAVNKAKCLFDCLKGKYPLPRIIEVVLKCKQDTKCYVQELGPDVIDCLGQCLALYVDPETNDKAKCLFNCLKGKYSLIKIIEVVLKCKQDTKCYVQELGPDVIDCLGQCLALDVDPETNNKAQCLWKCLKGKYPLEKIIAVVLLCKNNVACYAIELGPSVVDCVNQCILVSEEEALNKAKCLFDCLKGKYPLPRIIEVVLKCKQDTKCYVQELGPDVIECLGHCLALDVDPATNDKAKCLFDCLKGKYSLIKIIEVVLKCRQDTKCYVQELGPDVIDCLGQCLAVVDVETNDKAKCLFNCLKGKYSLIKIIEVVLKCKQDTKCYVQELGPDVIDCLGQCLALDVDPATNDKAKCLFDCLKGKYSLIKIIEVVLKCRQDTKCYVQELGPDVIDCLGQCLAFEDLKVEPDMSDVNCLYDCLKGKFPYQRIIEVVMKCQKDVKCYIQELGPDVIDCVFQCRKLQPQQVDLIKCLFDCLKGKYDWWKLAEVVIKCRDDKQCYVQELGPDVLECLGTCLAEHPDEETLNKAKCLFDCMKGQYPFERILAIVMKCKKDWMCYVQELGPDVKKCIAQCF